MPKISMFFGIAIYMYFKDHAPAHFHAKYNEYEALVDIRKGVIIEGELPRRAANLVIEWAELHRDELLADWELCIAMQQPNKIEPLE
ncbi:MAG: hypothetical protein NVS3B3_15040 [Aquirhabdus sp.]